MTIDTITKWQSISTYKRPNYLSPSAIGVTVLFTLAICIMENVRHMRFVSIVLTRIRTVCSIGVWKKLLSIFNYPKLQIMRLLPPVYMTFPVVRA